MNKQCAVIDIGTNSVRLLVAELNNGIFIPLETRMKVTRLGEGMTNKKFILPQAVEKTFHVIARFIQHVKQCGILQLWLIATAWAREAVNANSLIEMVKRELALTIKILTAEEEAILTYKGVKLGFKKNEDIIVVDIGGGSTEFITEQAGRIETQSISLGALGLIETYLHSDPPGEEEIDAATRFIYSNLERVLGIETFKARRQLIGVGGTVTTVAAILQRMSVYHPHKIHGFLFTLQELVEEFDTLKRVSLDARRNVAGLDSARADTILGGMLILKGIMEIGEWEKIKVSEYNVVHGWIAEAWGLC